MKLTQPGGVNNWVREKEKSLIKWLYDCKPGLKLGMYGRYDLYLTWFGKLSAKGTLMATASVLTQILYFSTHEQLVLGCD